jgi:hypothetical protein
LGVIGFFLTIGRVAASGARHWFRPRVEKVKNYRLR